MAKFNELLSKEKEVYTELESLKLKVQIMRKQLKTIINNNHLTTGLSREAHHFQQLFAYYQMDLIPALEEAIRMGQKHITLAAKNPDKSFQPFKIESKNHLKIARQFFNRFEQLEKEYQTFSDFIKQNTSSFSNLIL